MLLECAFQQLQMLFKHAREHSMAAPGKLGPHGDGLGVPTAAGKITSNNGGGREGGNMGSMEGCVELGNDGVEKRADFVWQWGGFGGSGAH